VKPLRLGFVAAFAVLFLIGIAGARGEPRVKSGTGFYVSLDGYAVTTSHVLAGCPRNNVSVWGRDHVQRSAKVYDDDPGWDIALLKVDIGVPFLAGRPRYLPGKVFVLGYGVFPSRPLEPYFTEGTYQGRSRYDDQLSAPYVLRIRARLHPGDSGGAVIGERGGLIGMVRGRYSDEPDIGVILPSAVIEAFLSKSGLRLAGRPDAPMLPPRDVLDAISVLVQCSPRQGDRG